MSIFKKKQKPQGDDRFNSYVRYLAKGLKAWNHHFESTLGYAGNKRSDMEKFISDYNELINRLFEMCGDS